jgi:hypothetical protein
VITKVFASRNFARVLWLSRTETLRAAQGGFPMFRKLAVVCLGAALAVSAAAQERSQTALTIYNHDFAVVRQGLTLDLKSGLNQIRFGEATLRLEPDSVILRDLNGHRLMQVLEQNYRNDPVSQDLMLSLFEGRTLEFAVRHGEKTEIIQGRVVRSGYVPHGGSQQPIIEVDGKLQFFLPGQPLFPSLADDTILKPTLHWLIQTDRGGASQAEVAYVTGGMSWQAAYNIVAPEKGDMIDLVGWITMNNQSGKTFDNARIKLMAGDVNKIVSPVRARYDAMKMAVAESVNAAPAVTEKAFDEYHLYTLEHPTTLHDQETKQVEFVRGTSVKSQRLYVYEGFDTSRYGWYGGAMNQDPTYGTQSNSKIWVMQEFKNSKENNLGIALPRGRVRFYRRDDDGQLQFTGENVIDHTPSDETIRLYTGNSFDVVGERRRTDFHVDSNRHYFDETFEIKIRNHKKEAVQVRVVERLYRWTNWQIAEKSHKFVKKDAQMVEFPVNVAPDGEQVVTYTVHYSW